MSANNVNTFAMPSPVRHGRVRAVAAAALVAVGLLAGCASGPQGASVSASSPAIAPEQAVRAMAAQRWQALVEGDFAKAYAFATPSYRKINSLEQFRGYKQGTTVKWVAAEILRVDCDASKCVVQIELESKLMTPIRIKSTVKSGVEETWVLEDGKWWMFEKL